MFEYTLSFFLIVMYLFLVASREENISHQGEALLFNNNIIMTLSDNKSDLSETLTTAMTPSIIAVRYIINTMKKGAVKALDDLID